MDLLASEEQERKEQQRLTFEVFGLPGGVTIESFSTWFGVDRFQFYTTDELRGVAGEKIARGRPKYETDFDDAPGVYIFTSLTDDLVLKVGQSTNLRQRVGVDHLRDRNQFLPATIRDYYSCRAGNWPDHLFDDQVTLCVFRIPHADERLRLSAELLWLQATLRPILP